jgi:hypothetical protein
VASYVYTVTDTMEIQCSSIENDTIPDRRYLSSDRVGWGNVVHQNHQL